ncbi:hypothetical protein D3C80_1918680 [compost metagenome]
MSAGHFVDRALFIADKVDEAQRFLHLLRDNILLKLLNTQSEGHILEHVQMREQGVILKYRIDLTLVGGNVVDHFTI